MLYQFMTCICTVPALCRNSAFRFSYVWVLVLGKGEHLDESLFTDLIAEDEAGCVELVQHFVHAAVVVGQDLDAYPFWAILKATFAVGERPKPGE
ncbi:MAG: hypothetical protein C0607_06060 [Azoarcus sp.]|nr:MAG: hypothetical protein C0607_06060 [Azoarcus sp.]